MFNLIAVCALICVLIGFVAGVLLATLYWMRKLDGLAAHLTWVEEERDTWRRRANELRVSVGNAALLAQARAAPQDASGTFPAIVRDS